MRNQWRLLLRRCQPPSLSSPSPPLPSSIIISRSLTHLPQVTPCPSISSVSSLPHSRSNPYAPQPASPFNHDSSHRYFSSEPSIDSQNKSAEHVTVIDIFSRSISSDEIKHELDSNNIVMTHDLVLDVLKNVKSDPKTATKFFDWVSERESERMSSQVYNWMLGILGSQGSVEKFWNLVDSMKKNGYGVKKGAYDKTLKRFEEDGLVADVEKLKGLFDLKNDDDFVSARVSMIIKQDVWCEDVEKKLRDLNVSFSSNLIESVLEKLSSEPTKALIFFRWVEESGLFKHDQQTYNSMALVLDREDCIDRFWNIVSEMKNAGHGMEKETYVKILNRFIDRKMIKDSVDLYDFSLRGENKPSLSDFTFLLRKVVTAKELDMDLVKKVVKVFKENCRSEVGETAVEAVMKSLISVGRLEDCNKVLDVLLESGLKPTNSMKVKIAFMLSSLGHKDEASVFMANLEAFGCSSDGKPLVALVQGYCVAGDLEKASDCFKTLIEKEGGSSLGYPLRLLVNTYCNRNRAVEVCKLFTELIKEKELKPEHSTYKSLIRSLLVQGGFNEALELLSLMKNDGFPPYVNPLIDYVSRKGKADDAMKVLKAMTVNRFPSKSVFLLMFDAFFKSGRCHEAQNLLAECPERIKSDADVLDLFYAMKSKKTGAAAAATT